MKNLGIAILLLLFSGNLFSQGQIFGLKGGLTVGLQKWDAFERDPLFQYHGALSIESIEEGRNSALWGEIGYHIKGSALRSRPFVDINGNTYRPTTQEFQFRNISFIIGAKQLLGQEGAPSRVYYRFGIRGDYTVSTNLDQFDQSINLSFPRDDFVNKLNYGLTIGGGVEFRISDLVAGIVELNVSPDISKQYDQPAINNIPSPYVFGQTINIRQRKITNTVVELSLGILLWRKIEYID
ncbi:MAG: hypothetical protein KJP00_02725 [Bacteroidia bacterium]|nr:hypothetical protein [Bacteroidia bacterium]